LQHLFVTLLCVEYKSPIEMEPTWYANNLLLLKRLDFDIVIHSLFTFKYSGLYPTERRCLMLSSVISLHLCQSPESARGQCSDKYSYSVIKTSIFGCRHAVLAITATKLCWHP